MEFNWTHTIHGTTEIGVDPHFISVGDEVAPYCYASESSIEYRSYRSVPYTEERREKFRDIVENASPEQIAAACYVLAKAAAGDKEIMSALEALKENYPSLLRKAKSALTRTQKALVAEQKAKMASLEAEAVSF